MYYKTIGKVASAEYYFGKIPQRWPNSPWAVKAKTELAQLAKMPRKPSKFPARSSSRPGSNDPLLAAAAWAAWDGRRAWAAWAAWAAWPWAAWVAWAACNDAGKSRLIGQANPMAEVACDKEATSHARSWDSDQNMQVQRRHSLARARRAVLGR